MTYTQLSDEHVAAISAMVDTMAVSVDKEILEKYAHDETEDLHFLPAMVIKPADTAAVSAILAYCNTHTIPVTPRGAGTGLSGGALPVYGGVVLSTERLNQILSIDEHNFQVITQPGVITQALQEAVIEKGMYFPPDPASRGSCFIGGNVAEGSGGPRAVKYGVTKDYILNLEVVLPSGEVIETGANVLKNSTGYNLSQLIAGSEGTLGIVTKITLKLIPYPPFQVLMLAPFPDAVKACEAVAAVFKAGAQPSALEFMERDALEWSMRYCDDAHLILTDEVQAHLLIEVDGFDMEQIRKEAEQIASVMENFGALDLLYAESDEEKNRLWKLRRKVGEAVKSHSVYKEEDTVVPRYALPVLLDGVKKIGRRYGFQSVCYGHAGDGNLHVNIIRGEMPEQAWHDELPKAIREIFALCIKLGGTLSGEHGIGWVQKPYMDMAFSDTELALMQRIKHAFDPNQILNPGKIFPDK